MPTERSETSRVSGRGMSVLEQNGRYLMHAGAQCLGAVFEPGVRRGSERGGDGDRQQDQYRGE
ncbi:hypothetical protein [Rhodococcus sp. USK13]|uniref:hypothetical protein n=1 Tax=Rhodococcus sp. USK13 TaxID=2806442 RepID=UPI001BCE5813|nr:hypothetical protein [Rhodococcus sp. USK13]